MLAVFLSCRCTVDQLFSFHVLHGEHERRAPVVLAITTTTFSVFAFLLYTPALFLPPPPFYFYLFVCVLSRPVVDTPSCIGFYYRPGVIFLLLLVLFSARPTAFAFSEIPPFIRSSIRQAAQLAALINPISDTSLFGAWATCIRLCIPDHITQQQLR